MANVNSGEKLQFLKWYSVAKWFLLCQVAMLFSACVLFYINFAHIAHGVTILNIVVDIIIIVLLLILSQSIIKSRQPDKLITIFYYMMFAASTYVYLDSITNICGNYPPTRGLIVMAVALYYITANIFIWLFWYFICAWTASKNKIVHTVTIILNICEIAALLLIIGNIFGGYYYTIDYLGNYKPASLYYLSLVAPAVIFVTEVVYIFILKGKASEKLLLIVYALSPFLGMAVNMADFVVSLSCPIVCFAITYIYSSMYVRRERELLIKQTELAESQVNSMLLQINPHFIYNTLGSVASLCLDDPHQARNMLFSFSAYLRENLSELSKQNLIPFNKEISHLETYIDIEKMRFPDITVEYNLESTEFNIPSLSVQPLVENAINHGIAGRESGGTIKISSYEDMVYFHVVVEDDGVGFNMDAPQIKSRPHIGLANVRNRLSMLCGGELIINSSMGHGTTVEIRIPKEVEK